MFHYSFPAFYYCKIIQGNSNNQLSTKPKRLVL